MSKTATIVLAHCVGGNLFITLANTPLFGTELKIPIYNLAETFGFLPSEMRDDPKIHEGKTLVWPQDGATITVTEILTALTGLVDESAEMARRGSVKTAAKANSSRINGAKGGRPRKNPVIS